MLNKALKAIHNFILLFGINISFVKKDSDTSPLLHNTQEEMDKFWSNPKYKKYWLSADSIRFYNTIIDLLKKNGIDLNYKNIADIGCGTGTLLYYVNQNFTPESITGYDFSNKALKIAKEKIPAAVFIQHDIYKIINQNYYLIFCTEVLEHLLYPGKALQNILSSIQNKGYAMITVPDGRKDSYSGHINFWSLESWDIFITDACPGCKTQTGQLPGFGLYALISKN